MTSTEQIRLECLKLAERKDWDASRVLEKARAYEEYVTAPIETKSEIENVAQEKKPVGRPRKNAGNVDFLD